jgi:hypothetical protein
MLEKQDFVPASPRGLASALRESIGGLFLAFPAIFPSGASLIENHEKKRRAKLGFDGTLRGRVAASVDAAGATFGSIALAVFALILWKGLPTYNAYAVIPGATLVWICIATTLWAVRRRRVFPRAT